MKQYVRDNYYNNNQKYYESYDKKVYKNLNRKFMMKIKFTLHIFMKTRNKIKRYYNCILFDLQNNIQYKRFRK